MLKKISYVGNHDSTQSRPAGPNSPGRPLHPRLAVPDDLGALFISSGARRFASLPAKGQRVKPRRKPSTRVAPPPGPMMFYEVARHGTLTDPTVRAPRVRADVFERLSPSAIRTTDELISEVDDCVPLASHFSILAEAHLASIEEELEDEDSGLGFIARRRLAFLAAALRHDPDTGWRNWVAHEGDPGLVSFKERIEDWLAEGIDWDEAEWFDSGWSGQNAALGFFSGLSASVRKLLSVVIIEGEHPGSSYYAAELRGEIGPANAAAQALGMAFRFRAQGQGTAAAPFSSLVVKTMGADA